MAECLNVQALGVGSQVEICMLLQPLKCLVYSNVRHYLLNFAYYKKCFHVYNVFVTPFEKNTIKTNSKKDSNMSCYMPNIKLKEDFDFTLNK